MGFLNWLMGISNDEARRLAALKAKRQQELGQKPFTGSEMDQGDYHSGPEGYSPNTAYPETQYGSMWDEDAQCIASIPREYFLVSTLIRPCAPTCIRN